MWLKCGCEECLIKTSILNGRGGDAWKGGQMRDLGTINIIRSVFFVFAGVCAGGNAWAANDAYYDIIPGNAGFNDYARMYNINNCNDDTWRGNYGGIDTDILDNCHDVATPGVAVAYISSSISAVSSASCGYVLGRAADTFDLCSSCWPDAYLVPVSQLAAIGAIRDCERLGLHSMDGYACVKCSQIESDTGWVRYGSGYEHRVVTGCGAVNTTYRCAAGYYGQSTDGVTGCERCPDIDGIPSTTANAGSTQKSSCCRSTNSVGRDAGGAFVYTTGCCGN